MKAAAGAARAEEQTMHHVKSPKAVHTAARTTRPSLSPYLLDEVTLTLSDIRRARTDDVTGR
jgi:hypothetical protein